MFHKIYVTKYYYQHFQNTIIMSATATATATQPVRAYYKSNREDVLSPANRKYREDNEYRQAKINYSNEYRRNHEEKNKEYQKQFYQQNKEILIARRVERNVKEQCACGKIVSRTNKITHLKTMYHRKHLNKKYEPAYDSLQEEEETIVNKPSLIKRRPRRFVVSE